MGSYLRASLELKVDYLMKEPFEDFGSYEVTIVKRLIITIMSKRYVIN